MKNKKKILTFLSFSIVFGLFSANAVMANNNLQKTEKVPSLVGMSKTQAVTTLGNLGFKVMNE